MTLFLTSVCWVYRIQSTCRTFHYWIFSYSAAFETHCIISLKTCHWLWPNCLLFIHFVIQLLQNRKFLQRPNLTHWGILAKTACYKIRPSLRSLCYSNRILIFFFLNSFYKIWFYCCIIFLVLILVNQCPNLNLFIFEFFKIKNFLIGSRFLFDKLCCILNPLYNLINSLSLCNYISSLCCFSTFGIFNHHNEVVIRTGIFSFIIQIVSKLYFFQLLLYSKNWVSRYKLVA
jgi:hypothetical protein